MKKYLYLITALVLFAVLGFTSNAAVAAPVFAQDEINDIFFNNVENWVDVDGSQDISQGDYFYGILHVQNIDGRISYTVWNEDNVLPGLDTFTGYFLTTVTGVTIEGGVQPHITLGPFTGGADPNSILSAAELASGVVLKMWTDSATKWTDFVSLGADIASSTDSTPWAAFTTIGGYWYTHAPLIPPVGAGNTVGHSFLGLKVVTNNSGLNFGSVNDPNESEINLNVDFVGQSEIQVNDNYWAFQSNDPAFILPVRCGDGIVGNTPGETCDPPDSVPNQTYPNNICRADCTFCGDGIVNNGEQCDFNDPNAPANCNTDCTLTPPQCGDGIVGNTAGETCDPPGSVPNPSLPNNTCRGNCTYCGDGIKDGGEDCDFNDQTDPNVQAGHCSTSCTILPFCGDGIVGNTAGETCDPPGSNAGQPNECRANCTFCGDGILDAGEQCDDHNNTNGDGCSSTCTIELFGGCRMTGGHNTVAPDGSVYVVPGDSEIIASVVSYGNGKKNNATTTQFKYTVGGQIGAPQAGCCTPGVDCAPGNGGYGEWEHSHHENGTLKFSFHAGTHSAPPDSYIQCITCSDPFWCVQARCAPFKQIFWEGTGVFQNPNPNSNSPFTLSGCTIDPVAGQTHSLHYYQAHVGDFGEPGNTGNQKSYDAAVCSWHSGGVEVENTVLMQPQPPQADPKFPQFFDKGGVLCEDCPDWYEIEIHCTDSPSSPIIYKAAGYLTGGNHQIHPAVGQQCPY